MHFADNELEGGDRTNTLLRDAFAFIEEDLSVTSLGRATLFRWEPRGEHLYVIATVGTERLVELARGIANQDGFLYPRSAARTGRTIVGNVGDGSWPDTLKQYAGEVGINSVLSVPVVLGTKVIAVINFFFGQILDGQRESVRNIEGLGRIIAQAVANNFTLRLKAERQARHVRSLAHEASNLIKAVEQTAELLLFDEQVIIPQETSALVYHMISNLKDAVLLLKNVASAERISMGDFRVSLRRAELSPVVRQAIEKRAILFEKAYSVKISTTSFPSGVYGLIDPFLLQRAIENVLVNACRFSPPGETVIVCAVLRESMYMISVSDRGPGIPQEFVDAVFEEFFVVPADSAPQRKGQEPSGSGLGLFIAREIIKQHNGFIGVDRDYSPGCRMVIGIPLLAEEI
jgi:signal transduction histidine kinase